jgi:PmbA protein
MVLVTSHGFHGAYLGSRYGLSMTAIAGEGTAMERDYDFSSTSHSADLEPPEKIGRTAAERAVERLNPRKASTGKVAVVFDRRVSASLIGHLASAINGAAVARKTSFLMGKLGERLFAPGIRIIDDPLRKRGQRSRPFDGEGVAGNRIAVVDDGVLTTWFLDSATARELGKQTTGHAARGVSSNPSPSPTNLHLEPGSISPDALIADIEEGFYITDLIGSGTNIVTGDYSRGAAGFWIEKGKRSYPVSEVTIAGHLKDVFRTLTPANDLEFRFGTNAPTLRVEGLTVAGR